VKVSTSIKPQRDTIEVKKKHLRLTNQIK